MTVEVQYSEVQYILGLGEWVSGTGMSRHNKLYNDHSQL